VILLQNYNSTTKPW